jgi:ribosomal protein L7/L12
MSPPDRDLPQDVVDALQRGEIVGALKRLLAHRGIGRAPAVQRAGFPPAPPGPSAPPEPVMVPPAVDEALRNGNRIEAVRLLREATGLGLKQAKAIVDARPVVPSVRRQGLAPGEVPRSSGLGWWLAVAAVIAWAVWRLWERGTWV